MKTNESNPNAFRVDVSDGKYSVLSDGTGKLTALRHGEPWPARDLCGDNFVFSLAFELNEARERLRDVCEAIERQPKGELPFSGLAAGIVHGSQLHCECRAMLPCTAPVSPEPARFYAIVAADRSGPAYGVGESEDLAKEDSLNAGFEWDDTVASVEITPMSYAAVKAGNPDAWLAVADGPPVSEDLPPLPPVPEGWDAWEDCGVGPLKDAIPSDVPSLALICGEWMRESGPSGGGRGGNDLHYFKAVRRG